VSKGGRSLTPDERKLWARVATGVRPRRGKTAPVVEEEGAPLERAPRKAANAAPHVVKAKQTKSPPQDRAGERRVRRGQVEIGARLDLHGHTLATARSALIRFMHAAYKRGDRTVIVITGVGRGGHGVLKQSLPDWLGVAEIRPFIAGFAQAHRAHGGAGALYVFLKRPAAKHD